MSPDKATAMVILVGFVLCVIILVSEEKQPMSEGIRVSEISQGSRTTKFYLNGHTVNVDYDPNLFTPAAEGEWQQLQEEGAWQGTIAAEFIAKLVNGWDLLGDAVPKRENGEIVLDENEQPVLVLEESEDPFPLEVRKLSILPNVFLDKVVTAIAEDMAPKARRRRGSGAG